MLLQTNSYIVPRDRRAEHERLMRRIRQSLARLGCDHYEVYEQVGANWSSGGEKAARFVQIMRFRDRKHQLAVQTAEKNDPGTQALIKEFCELINFPYQQQQGLFAIGYYQSVLPVTLEGRAPEREIPAEAESEEEIEGPGQGLPGEDTVETGGAPEPDEPAEEGAMEEGPAVGERSTEDSPSVGAPSGEEGDEFEDKGAGGGAAFGGVAESVGESSEAAGEEDFTMKGEDLEPEEEDRASEERSAEVRGDTERRE